ncbi:MAG: hypothetical protein WB987_14470 [Candidatus Acidiferrales bacterium]
MRVPESHLVKLQAFGHAEIEAADAKMLAQLDVVFLTVVPSGWSQKASGRLLLFACLKIDPNPP